MSTQDNEDRLTYQINAAVGFAVIWRGTDEGQRNSTSAINQAISHFDDLNRNSIIIGETRLELWGREKLSECVHFLPDGSLLALIGSPLGDFSWVMIQEMLDKISIPADFKLPWDGRVVLLRISPDGKHWTMWNDWLGSIPVFHSGIHKGRIASTLEPAVVAAAGFTQNDFFLPGLINLLVHGNFISDWTLFDGMKVVAPDCAAEWDAERYHYENNIMIEATDERWESGWDELVDGMYTLSRKAIADVLKTQSSWALPLSSGLDSRLIAAVAADLEVDVQTYTWGPLTTRDVIYAKRIAAVLGLPWERIDLGEDYLLRYVHLWADLFGSAMHFHGMYQMPFLDEMRSGPPGPILSGFIGECLAGYDVLFQSSLHDPNERIYQSHPDAYLHWQVQELHSLLKVPIDDALDQVTQEIHQQRSIVPGPWFQSLRFLTLWGRQRHFTYFQSMLSAYWRGVATPFLNREYARFCLSLPRAVLDNRRLQVDMFQRYYPKLASIPGTYAPEPATLSGSYLLKRRFASVFPHPLSKRMFPEFYANRLIETDTASMRHTGKKTLWPIHEVWESLGEWLDLNQLEAVYDAAISGDMKSVRKLQSVQAIAFRMLN